jgi:CheY-like chemotaxis protein
VPEFDALLLDVHMPGLDGFQVVQAIRERERATGGHLPVIALTARARREDREQCLAAGMDDFLSKPVQAADLWAAIDRLGVSGGMVSGSSTAAPLAATSPTTHHPPLTTRLLDPRVLLAACGGEPGILEKICDAFRAHLPDHLAVAWEALRERDAPRLREAAHKLAAMVGAFSTVPGGVASDLEDHADRSRLEEAPALVEQLETMARELMHRAGGLSFEALQDQANAANGLDQAVNLRS